MSEHAASPNTTSRRSLLKTGGFAAVGAAVLAACGPDHQKVGVSGDPVTATSTPPTIPDAKVTAAVIAANQSQLHTLSSVEALVAEVYSKNASGVTDPELRAAVDRYGKDHEAAAKAMADATIDKAMPGPNEELRTAMVDPMQGLLTDQEHILTFFGALESTLAATYITAVGVLSEASDRQLVMTYGAACARRMTVLSNGGEGEMPLTALFPIDDLIPGAAYLDLVEEAGDSADGGDPAEGKNTDGNTGDDDQTNDTPEGESDTAGS